MKKKTKGAWLLHHGRKLQATTSQDFDAISFASKCGTMLSAISAEHQTQLTQKRVEALARANGISPKAEVPAILTELQRQKIVLCGKNGIEVLGLTGQTVLESTSTIFDESEHETYEDAVITLSELASESPITDTVAGEFLSDQYKLSKHDANNTLSLGGNIGFFDSETISPTEKLIFNGNLFRREDAKKVNAVLGSIKAAESQSLVELNTKAPTIGLSPATNRHPHPWRGPVRETAFHRHV